MTEFIMKETEELITFKHVWKRYDPASVLIRCRDCKYFNQTYKQWLCERLNRCVDEDWFCADGEKEGGKET